VFSEIKKGNVQVQTKEDNIQKKKMASICLRFNYDPNKNHLNQLLAQLLTVPHVIKVDPPIKIEMGTQLAVGERCYLNSGVTILDGGSVSIGDDVLIGPNVQIYSVGHPLDYKLRAEGKQVLKPVVIESNVWIGGGSIICPGVVVGKYSVIAAGSVVTKNVAVGVMVGGNPAKFIKKVDI